MSRQKPIEDNPVEYYGDKFYKSQMDGSYDSATFYTKHLAKYFIPLSVADVGCGRGTWLKAFKGIGAERLVGFDGGWNDQTKMVDKSIVFIVADFNNPLPYCNDKFDLAVSLEVAEHVKEESAKSFIENLTNLADAVMFGAAYTKQGGTNHINEQAHTYWAKIFDGFGFVPYDIFRPVFWGNANIEYWYQQNTFLYVKKESGLNTKLASAGQYPIPNRSFMDCIHPSLYDLTLSRASADSLSGASAKMHFKYLLIKCAPKYMVPLMRKYIWAP